MNEKDRRHGDVGPHSPADEEAQPDHPLRRLHENPLVAAGMYKRHVQRKAARREAAAASEVAIPDSGGAALGGDVRGRMEGGIGGDLSGVKVHTGSDSAKAAEQLGARAFTVGRDVHFNRGEYAPGT